MSVPFSRHDDVAGQHVFVDQLVPMKIDVWIVDQRSEVSFSITNICLNGGDNPVVFTKNLQQEVFHRKS